MRCCIALKHPLHSRRFRQAFTLVELLVVIAIVGILLAILLPATQSIRESARRMDCSNKLRQIGIAAHQYQSSFRAFPPGTLGFKELFDFQEHWFNDSSQFYWKNAQHTSSLGILLPYFELRNLYDKAHPSVFNSGSLYDRSHGDWIGLTENYSEIANMDVGLFFCPSDTLDQGSPDGTFGATHPVILGPTQKDGFGGVLLEELTTDRFSLTSYLGCSGAASGGEHPDKERRAFNGIMQSRLRTKATHVRDGLSNTILYGESNGWNVDREFVGAQSWLTGGLARGRSNIPWKLGRDPNFPKRTQLGDSVDSYAFGFGSAHPLTVNFVHCDGSVHRLSRDVHWLALYRLCGATDGGVELIR